MRSNKNDFDVTEKMFIEAFSSLVNDDELKDIVLKCFDKKGADKCQSKK